MRIDTTWGSFTLTAANREEYDQLFALLNPETLVVGDTYEWWLDRRIPVTPEHIRENITYDPENLRITNGR